MHLPLTFIRLLFLGLCTLLSTAYTISQTNLDPSTNLTLIGAFCGLAFGVAVISLDTWFGRLNLRAFNVAALGLFFGYLMGEAIMLVFQAALNTNIVQLAPAVTTGVRAAVFLGSCYFGMVMTARTSEELYLSIPFIKFKPGSQLKKDLLIDSSALSDPRLLDLATTGLIDQELIVPRYLARELQEQVDSNEEVIRSKARRSLDALKKLEVITALEMRYTDTDCPDVKDPVAKILKLARLLDANILTAEMSRSQQTAADGPRIINLNVLSQALKPLSQTGELLNIKIQRYGKEPRQGVGYLDDGTMVVVNGGAEFIGESIRTQVLSVKHTTSGRMIFCNALDCEFPENEPTLTSSTEGEGQPSNYFAH